MYASVYKDILITSQLDMYCNGLISINRCDWPLFCYGTEINQMMDKLQRANWRIMPCLMGKQSFYWNTCWHPESSAKSSIHFNYRGVVSYLFFWWKKPSFFSHVNILLRPTRSGKPADVLGTITTARIHQSSNIFFLISKRCNSGCHKLYKYT